MIVQIPTNLNSRHLAKAAYKAYDDFNADRITEDQAKSFIDPFNEVLAMMEKRETPTGKERNL